MLRSTTQDHDLFGPPPVILRVGIFLGVNQSRPLRYRGKSGLSGSTLQTIDGAFVVGLNLIKDLVPLVVTLYCACGNILLQGLNWF